MSTELLNKSEDNNQQQIMEQKQEEYEQPEMNREPTIEECELKFEKSVHPFLPKLKTLQSAMFKLYPSVAEIEKDTVHQIWIQGEEHMKKARPHFYKNYIEYQQIQNGRSFLWSEEMIESLIVHEYKELLTLYHS